MSDKRQPTFWSENAWESKRTDTHGTMVFTKTTARFAIYRDIMYGLVASDKNDCHCSRPSCAYLCARLKSIVSLDASMARGNTAPDQQKRQALRGSEPTPTRELSFACLTGARLPTISNRKGNKK